MNIKVIIILLCAVSCCLAKNLRGRQRQRPRHGGWEEQGFRPHRGNYGYQEFDDFNGYQDGGYYEWEPEWDRPNNDYFRPSHHHHSRLPPFMTVGFHDEEEVEEEYHYEEPARPAPPSQPLNPILSTLSDLPLSLYNSYICNMFGTQQVSPNVDANLIREKRALFSSGFFRMIRNFRRVVGQAYTQLKPFNTQSDNELLAKIQTIALSVMDVTSNRGLQVKDVVQAFIEDVLQSEGIVGSAQNVFEAIQKLSNEKKSEIEDSTMEAVDKSCGVINNEFYCNYMKKLSANSGCSSNFFSTEILDKCCSAFATEESTTPTPVVVLTEPVPQAPETTTPTPVVVPTEPNVPTTTKAPLTTTPKAPVTTTPKASVTTTTKVPVTTTPKAPVTTTTSVTTTTTTQAPTSSCGISKVNPAQGFGDFSSAMNQVRIVGGVDTEKCEYPWMVRLQVGNSLCGGTIIDETHILTAGHCIGSNTPSDITVHAGEYDYNTRDSDDVTHTVKAIDIHEEYTEFPSGDVVLEDIIRAAVAQRKGRLLTDHDGRDSTLRFFNTVSPVSDAENDVAILTLDEPLEYNDCVQPICLPNAGDGAAIEAGTQCVVAGWGTTSSGGETSNILQEVTVPTYSGADCDSVFSQTTPSNTDLQLCAGRPVIGGADSCQGDSGGPLFCPVNGQYVQYGVVSYGAGCADAGAAGVYADTSAMLDFINRVTTA